MQAVGVDIVEIPRIESVIKRWGKTSWNGFHPAELKLYDNTPSLAARFAAKEAVLKALGPVTKALVGRTLNPGRSQRKAPDNLSGKQKFKPKICYLQDEYQSSHSKRLCRGVRYWRDCLNCNGSFSSKSV